MDEDNKVVADTRESFGKGAARKIRAAGKIPAVIYGHGTDPQHIALPGAPGGPAHPQGERRARPADRRQEPARPRQGRAEGPGAPDHRAPRPHRHQAGREGPGRGPRAHRGRVVLRHHRRPRRQDPAARGRGHPHPRVASSSRSRASRRAPRSTRRTSSCPRARRSSATPRRSSCNVHVPQKVDLGEEAAEAAAAEAAARPPRPRPPRGRGRVGRVRRFPRRGLRRRIRVRSECGPRALRRRPPRAATRRPQRTDADGTLRPLPPPAGRTRPWPRTPGSWSASATPARSTRATGTTSARWSPTSSPPASARRSRRHKTPSRVAEGFLRPGRPEARARQAQRLHEHVGRAGVGAAEVLLVPVDRLIVVHDELDIPFDTVRLKHGGGHGGHNGLRDISKATDARDVHPRARRHRPPARAVRTPPTSCSRTSRPPSARRCRICCRMPRTPSRRSRATGSWPRSSGSTRRPERESRRSGAWLEDVLRAASDEAAQELLG